MQNLEFKIDISAPKEKVWSVMWQKDTFSDWASVIDEGTYMIGEIKIGNEVQFVSSEGGYGVTSLVEKLVDNEFVQFRQIADTQDYTKTLREKEWTGSIEVYKVLQQGDITTVSWQLDIPANLLQIMQDRIPKALERLKFLVEQETVS